MRPKRRYGQNFLVGHGYPARIVAALGPRPGEEILEIGPGEGALTQLLLEAGAHVTAIEVDADLIPLLNARFGATSRFRLLHADALTVDLGALHSPGLRVRVVANLPYYISTAMVQHLLAHRHCVEEMVLMLQREVVERIIAPPGSRTYGYLSILVQLFCRADVLFDVPPGAFHPAPKVDSSVLRLRPTAEPAIPVGDVRAFLTLCQVLFSQRRKTLANNLRAGLTRLGLGPEAKARLGLLLAEAQIDGQRRAETLSLTELAALDAVLSREVTEAFSPNDPIPLMQINADA
jgi:16S rRNA (adenine1518-N6/adenine1519-N6)-dimethyltransferase